VVGKPDRHGDDSNSSFRLSSYPLRSLPKSDLQLHSPLRTPKRLNRNNLVSETIGAPADMPGSAVDPAAMTDAEKLNFLISQMTSVTDQQTSLLAQVTTINTRLETHGKQLATLEKAPVDPAVGAEDLDLSRGRVTTPARVAVAPWARPGKATSTPAARAMATTDEATTAVVAAVDLAARVVDAAVVTSTADRSMTEAGVVDMIVIVRRMAATVAPSSTSHLSTGRLTRCRGSTSAGRISMGCAPWQKKRCGSHPCTSKAWRLTGTMPWSGIMLSPLGQGLQSS
jgi:hypothetical protein